MARETKVGLIVGLAFIICFAIILANRGQPLSPPATAAPYRIDGGTQVQGVIPSAPPSVFHPPSSVADSGGDQGHAPVSPGQNARRDPRPVEQRAPQEPGRFMPTNGSEVVLTADGASAPGMGMPDQGFDRPAEQGWLRGAAPSDSVGLSNHPSTLERMSEGAVAGGVPEQVERTRLLQQRLDQINSRSTSTGPADSVGLRGSASFPNLTPETAPFPQRTPEGGVVTTPDPRKGTIHRVAPGETLYKIAAARYGARSTSIVNAIFEANRSLLSDRNRLPVGTVLMLPIIGVESQSSSLVFPGKGASPPAIRPDAKTSVAVAARKVIKQRSAKPTAKGAKTPPSPSSRGFEWYQVKKNDRYASIAREQLGDVNRWHEIHELNKDKFPNPGQIREGVRIKLPVVVKTDIRSRA